MTPIGSRRPADGAGDYRPEVRDSSDAAVYSLGAYDVERELGRGGTAIVYLVRERDTGRRVAFKILRAELALAVGVPRFLREIDIEGRLGHPNILPIHESGSVDGRPFYTMPYVDGETLRDRIRRERHLPVDAVLSIARAVAAALDHAHAQRVIHRDVKPANILLARDGGIFLADFGIARAMTVATGEQITDSGIFVGTPEYMSPEQAEPKPSLDGRSDVYALGCVVYEMLAAEPPFTGPTAQAIVARHAKDSPRSLAVIRPTLGPAVQGVLERALAKVPADRYATATEMVDALAAALAIDPRERRRAAIIRWATVGLGAAVVAAVAIAGVQLSAWLGDGALDANRVVVFPLRDSPGATGPSGEEVATYIGYALEGTRPLTWLEGWDLMSPTERANVAVLTTPRARRVSRSVRAAFFVDGSILRSADSTTVVLELHSVAGDSVIARAGASGPGSIPQTSLRAIATLLPALLAPGRRPDLSALERLNPTAVANFLQGEREYRRMHFDAAIEYYRNALQDDSLLALAALRGAEAANWQARYGEDTAFAAAALRRADQLPPVRAHAARGLYAYLRGDADSAIVHLRRAIDIDSTSAPVWTLLGEVYTRMLPSVPFADSLGRSAFEHARRIDPDFAPALLLLEEAALREGRVNDAIALGDALRRAGADSTHLALRDLMRRCVQRGTAAIDWRDAARRQVRVVEQAGKVLSAGGAQAACARGAFEAALRSDSADINIRWGALLGLQSVLVAMGRDREIPALLSSSASAGLPAWALYAMDDVAGADVHAEAVKAVAEQARNVASMSSSSLYLLATWRIHRAAGVGAEDIERELRRRVDSLHARNDSLLLRAVDARLPLLRGDTAETVRRLRALRPTGTRTDLAWQPGESLGAERLLLAQLLYARREFDDAIRVAELLDAPEPIVYLLYLRPSLALRVNAAKNLGGNAGGTVAERRLNRLDMQVHEGLPH